ncbi:TPA: hypothetical protein IBZ33_001915 [Escherichia coli]|nr:hypothetical protein [Escherichia coli]HBD1946088.1 hypothetical protein [Escherichia coli]
MKIIAAFCIVVVHSGTFPEFGYLVGGLLENCTRWALPFFFLTSGFMLGLAREINLGRKVNKILQILFWSSIIYLPIIFIKSIVMHDSFGNDSNLLIVFYVQIMPDDLVMQLHRF